MTDAERVRRAANRHVPLVSHLVLGATGAARAALDLPALQVALETRHWPDAHRLTDVAINTLVATLEGRQGTKAAGEGLSPAGGLESALANTLRAGAGATEVCVLAETRESGTARPAVPGWEAALTDADRAAARSYTQGKQAGPLNEALRDGRALTEDQANLARHLDALIAKAGQARDPMTVFRGVNFGRAGMPSGADLAALPAGRSHVDAIRGAIADFASERFPIGATVELGGYQSTSFYVDPALDASLSRQNPGVVFEITTHRGAYLSPALSGYDDEGELLLGRATRYRVIAVRRAVNFIRDNGTQVLRTVVSLAEIN